MSTNTVVRSGGYGGQIVSPLNEPIISQQIISVGMATDILPDIVNSNIIEDELTEGIRYGSSVHMLSDIDAGSWRPKEDNQTFVSDEPTANEICFTVGKQAYKQIKLSDRDYKLIMERRPEVMDMTMRRIWNKLSLLLTNHVTTLMNTQVSDRTSGIAAGLNGNINLGSVGNPIAINKDNYQDILSLMQTTIEDQNRWEDSMDAILLTNTRFNSLVKSYIASNTRFTSGEREAQSVRDYYIEQALGAPVITSNLIPRVIDPFTGQECFYIYLYDRRAFGFVFDITEAIHFGPDSNSDRHIFRTQVAYGGQVLYPDAISIAYVTIQP